MRQRLRKIAGEAAGHRIVFFRQQPEIVRHRGNALQQHLGAVDVSTQHIGIGEPERASQEGSFNRRLFVRNCARIVPEYEAVRHQMFLDSRQRPGNTRIGRWEEANRRNQKRAGVEHLRTVGFDEGVLVAIKALLADVAMDGIAQFAPVLDRRLEPETFGTLDAAIECHPDQHH